MERYVQTVRPGERVELAKISTRQDGGLTKEEGQAQTDAWGRRLGELGELLFAAGQHSLLVVLQGRDTSGKDGAIRGLLRHLNVQSTRVVPFKVPTEAELAHDFLWRIHRETPGRGEIAVFNRSHYEDVLVVRVHDLVPKAAWEGRYAHINQFERLLTDAGTILVKAYLHISSEEQEERLLAREKEPEKAWKLNVGDWKERGHWPAYEQAYEDALSRCTTEWAPWHVVPADRKWFRDLALAELLVRTLEPYAAGWRESLKALGEKRRADLAAFRSHGP